MPKDSMALFDKFKENLTQDFVRNFSAHMAEQKALQDIDATFFLHGHRCADFNLPTLYLVGKDLAPSLKIAEMIAKNNFAEHCSRSR